MNSIPKPKLKPVIIREVWAFNLEAEFQLIRGLIHRYPFISMDTEFPGVIFKPAEPHNHRNLRPTDTYRFIKANVDVLNLIQVGLTLSDAVGNLPDLGTDDCTFIWQFNFRDFNVTRDAHAPDSVALLRSQGIDFARNASAGVDSARFARLMMWSGLLRNNAVSWLTFHSAYDFAYLIKILTRRSLPVRLEDFLRVVRVFFGDKVYDIKHLVKFCDSLYGGLDRIGQILKVDRVAGKSHQAGSDSLHTMQVFQKIKDVYFDNDGYKKHVNVLYGLELEFNPSLNHLFPSPNQTCSSRVVPLYYIPTRSNMMPLFKYVQFG
ncbi:probable CCR4-associated factor 1 homolog 11 [Lotus japonicus]|uniref:probable CCR4-associated factor 1 homolog 11 n=1 Tax=Lotus japonicus TaxID=34305 RepID=UPI002590C2BE|nr:probable CCR4-associated factor 1 homolog 11 [Lotus japonicus]